jgi:hypothetical protein
MASRGLSSNALRDSPTPERVLAEYAAACSEQEVNQAYATVARGVAVLEQTPRSERGPARRRQWHVLAAERKKRKEVLNG